MINKLAENVCMHVEFQSVCNWQLLTLKTELYLVVPSSPSDGQDLATEFVTHHDELPTLSERLSSGRRNRRPTGAKRDKQRNKRRQIHCKYKNE